MKTRVQIQFTLNINLGRGSIKLFRALQGIRRNLWLQALVLVLLAPALVYAASLVKQHTFSSGEVISSSEVNENFDKLYEAAPRRNPSGNGVQFAENVDATGFTVNGVAVASSTDSFWSTATGGINFGSGNVGINQANPSQPLDVNGNANISGNLVVSGTIMGTVSTLVAIANGGTGATSAATARTNLGVVNIGGDTMTGTLNLPTNGLAVGTSEFVVTAGNAGIGIAAPATKLHVSGGTLRVEAENTFNPLVSRSYSDTATHYAGAMGYRARGTIATPTYVQSGDALAVFHGRDAINNAWGGMGVDASETHTASAGGTEVKFYTTANSGLVPSERMRITQAGDVGIGTTTPSDKLHVAGTAKVDDELTVDTFRAKPSTQDLAGQTDLDGSKSYIRIANAGAPASILTLSSCANGRIIVLHLIVSNNDVTFPDNASFRLSSGPYTMNARDTLTLLCTSATEAVELSRSVN